MLGCSVELWLLVQFLSLCVCVFFCVFLFVIYWICLFAGNFYFKKQILDGYAFVSIVDNHEIRSIDYIFISQGVH